MQSLCRNSQLFENDLTDTVFAKTFSTIVLDLSGTQYMNIVRTGSVRLECTFAEPLAESTVLFSLNQFEIYWEITFEGSVY